MSSEHDLPSADLDQDGYDADGIYRGHQDMATKRAPAAELHSSELPKGERPPPSPPSMPDTPAGHWLGSAAGHSRDLEAQLGRERAETAKLREALRVAMGVIERMHAMRVEVERARAVIAGASDGDASGRAIYVTK